MALSFITADHIFNHFINNLYKGNEYNFENPNKCLIFVDPLKICNLCCLLKAAKISKICFEKFATDSTVLS